MDIIDRRTSFYGGVNFSILLFLLLVFAKTASAAIPFEAQGILHMEDFVRKRLTDTRFDISVSGCKWFIHIERFANNPGNSNEVNTAVDVGSEGDRIYAVIYWSLGTNPISTPDGGLVRPGPSPHVFADYTVPYIWLAFASSCYFETANDHKAEPIFTEFSPMLYNATYTVPIDLVQDQVEPHLPVKITYFNDGIRRYWRKTLDM